MGEIRQGWASTSQVFLIKLVSLEQVLEEGKENDKILNISGKIMNINGLKGLIIKLI